ncbi:MAG: 4Fe-4S binding protein, partial [Gammaproteobacteria bacterium]
VGCRNINISGHLGSFSISLGDPEKPSFEKLSVDIIVDLSPEPLLQMPLKPLGYICSDLEESSLSRVLIEVESLVGTFEKPRFFNYDPGLCAHARNGHTACTQCLDACPAEAISSLAERVSVDPYLCQGGGICATVCPSGAMQYSYPAAGDLLSKVKTLLKVYRQQGGENPELVFVAEADFEKLPLLADNQFAIEVEELASVGMEAWLSCLAYGASHISLVLTGSEAPVVVDALEQQVMTSSEILVAMGYPASVIKLTALADVSSSVEVSMPEITATAFSAAGGKRQTAYMAIDYLYSQAVNGQAQQPVPEVSLTEGAPFGAAQVSAERCTLCLSCVSACPGKALMEGQDSPQLRFIEQNCIQCGMCTLTCPEDAISISPRLLFEHDKRKTPRVLFEEEPFNCVSCGKPFATHSVIDRMTERLKGHWMYNDERAMRRLQMCEDCRVVDVVQDEAAMQAGLNPINRQ